MQDVTGQLELLTAAECGPPQTLDQLSARMHDLVVKNGWYSETSRRPQTPRNLAMSLAVEASELLECFQWSDTAPAELVEDEMADILLYLIQLARLLDVDLSLAATKKLERNFHRTWDVERRAKA